MLSVAAYVIGLVISYLFGGIPFGFLAAKFIKGVDIRTVGSGNIGATNVSRILGKAGFAGVFVLDFLKGFLPVVVFAGVILHFAEGINGVSLRIILGLSAIIGHMFTPFLKFKGGKGVATSCGVFFGLVPVAAACALGVWVITLGIWRYVSLSSMLAAAALPAAFVLTNRESLGENAAITFFCALVALLVILRHASNIKRLVKGTESRIGRPDSKD